MGGAVVEVRAREVRVKQCEEAEEDHPARRFHSTLLLEKLRQVFRWATDREGGGGVSPRGGCLYIERATGFKCPPR